MDSNPNPFPWGMGWRAFLLGCSLSDRAKFEDTMEVCSNFTSMAEVHKEADAMVKKVTTKELKMLIPNPAKGAMSVDILHWAMNQANSSDAQQRAKWAKYRVYKCPNDDRAAVYWTTRTVVDPTEEDDELLINPFEPTPHSRTLAQSHSLPRYRPPRLASSASQVSPKHQTPARPSRSRSSKHVEASCSNGATDPDLAARRARARRRRLHVVRIRRVLAGALRRRHPVRRGRGHRALDPHRHRGLHPLRQLHPPVRRRHGPGRALPVPLRPPRRRLRRLREGVRLQALLPLQLGRRRRGAAARVLRPLRQRLVPREAGQHGAVQEVRWRGRGRRRRGAARRGARRAPGRVVPRGRRLLPRRRGRVRAGHVAVRGGPRRQVLHRLRLRRRLAAQGRLRRRLRRRGLPRQVLRALLVQCRHRRRRGHPRRRQRHRRRQRRPHRRRRQRHRWRRHRRRPGRGHWIRIWVRAASVRRRPRWFREDPRHHHRHRGGGRHHHHLPLLRPESSRRQWQKLS